MTEMDVWDDPVDREVERLFAENPPRYEKLCRNPVTGGSFVGGFDPTRVQKKAARKPLRAREWFRENGPADAQPFPISYDEREALKGTGLLPHIVAWYARSLEGRNYDVDEHPPFADFVRGVLWEAELSHRGFVLLPNYPLEEFQSLKKRFSSRMLKGMSPGLMWLPPKLHVKAMDDLRRSTRDGRYINRE